MENNAKYKKTFSRLTASEDIIPEVMQMDQKNVYRHMKKSSAIAAAAVFLLASTGAVYAATDGNLTALWKTLHITIDGDETDVESYYTKFDENGDPYLHFENGDYSFSYTLSEDAPVSDNLSLDIKTPDLDAPPEEAQVPFTLEADGDILYLVEKETKEKTNITAEAASENGYSYSYTDEDGLEQTAVIFGTPEEHSISTLGEQIVSIKAQAATVE